MEHYRKIYDGGVRIKEVYWLAFCAVILLHFSMVHLSI